MVLVARALQARLVQQAQLAPKGWQVQLACLARQVRKVLLAPKGWQACLARQAQQAFLVQQVPLVHKGHPVQ
jgi:hypothetical protein